MANFDEYISWEELELSGFFGDFRGDPISSDEGEQENVCSRSSSQPPESKVVNKNDVMYKCPSCSKTYKSQSGFSSHVIKKHDRKDVKACDHILKECKDAAVSQGCSPSIINKCHLASLSPLLTEAISTTLEDMAKSPFHAMPESTHGHHLVTRSQLLISSDTADIAEMLDPHMCELFSGFAHTGFNSTEREAFFARVHRLKMNFDLLEKIEMNILSRGNVGHSSEFVCVFLTCLIDDVVNAMIHMLLTKYQVDIEQREVLLSKHDQQVLHLIAGFLLFAAKKNAQHDQDRAEVLNSLTDSSEAVKEHFLKEFKSWTLRCDRGGLHMPCDKFFLIVRLFETDARRLEGTTQHKRQIGSQKLKEAILSNYLVNKYWDELVSEHFEKKQILLEEIVGKFIKVRVHALARKFEREAIKIAKKEKRKKPQKAGSSLRKVLKDSSVQ